MERGKYVVAVTEILPGDTVLVDTPLLTAPHPKSRPQCLECAR